MKTPYVNVNNPKAIQPERERELELRESDREPGVWCRGLGCEVWGLGFGVWGLGFRVWCLGFRV